MIPMTARIRAVLGFLGLALLVGSGTAVAQTYPDKAIPLKIVVPFGAGSATDVIARALGTAITEVSGVPVVIDNRPGADTLLGAQAVLSAPADGNTLLLVSSSTTVLNPLMIPNQPFDMLRDFVPLSAIARNHPAFNLGTSTTFRSVREFIAAAKAAPGKYTYGGASTTSQLTGQLLEARTGIEMLYVPYKTTAAALTALASGEVDLILVDAGSAKAAYGSGRVRPLAVGAPARISALPQVPTLIEEGIPDYQINSWFATYFSSRTPADRVAAMRAILTSAVRSANYREALIRSNLEPFDLSGSDISDMTRSEIDMWGKLLRATKLRQAR